MKSWQHDLFITRLWHFEVDECLSQHDAWQARIAQWRAAQPTPQGRSNRLGWNSDKTVFDDPLFRSLAQVCGQAFSHAFQQMQLREKVRFRLEAWVNLHDPGGFNTLHLHPNSLLSGCYYLFVPPGSGKIIFRDPRPGVTLAPFAGNGVHCQPYHAIEPKAGELYIFPNWLEHQVEVNEATESRVSIAMNAVVA